MNKKNMKFFKLAKEISKTSNHPRISIGAVITDKNTVISCGTNMHKTHPIQKKYNEFNKKLDDKCHHFIHAEISAIIHAGTTNLDGCSIYVYREDKNRNIAMCRPCPACFNFIKSVGIKKIYYTTPDGFCEENLENWETWDEE